MTLGNFFVQFIVYSIFFFLLVGLPLLGMFWAIRKNTAVLKRRDEMIVKMFGRDTKIYRAFPIPADLEEVIQGALHQYIQKFRELIKGDAWLFIQPTFRNLDLLTFGEDRQAVVLSLYARELGVFSPTFLVRNNKNKSLVSRYYLAQIKNGTFIASELNFDNEQSLFIEHGKHLQALQIMSPEVLEVMKDAPGKADILIKKNQLYYILPGGQAIETIIQDLIIHSSMVAKELSENLSRWGASASNREEYEKIKNSDLAVTLRESYEASQL